MAKARCTVLLLAVWFGTGAGAAVAQVTRADFERALNLQDQYKKLVEDLPENPAWEEKADRFVYRKSVPGGSEFVEVDAAAQTKQPPFDQQKLAAALSAAGGKKVEALNLPFSHFRYADERSAIEFRIENTRWRCDLKAYTCAKQQEFHRGDEEYESNDDYDDTPHAVNSLEKTKASPDGKWQAFIDNYNVWVRSADGKEKFSLSEDASEITTTHCRLSFGHRIRRAWWRTGYGLGTGASCAISNRRRRINCSRSIRRWSIPSRATYSRCPSRCCSWSPRSGRFRLIKRCFQIRMS